MASIARRVHMEGHTFSHPEERKANSVHLIKSKICGTTIGNPRTTIKVD